MSFSDQEHEYVPTTANASYEIICPNNSCRHTIKNSWEHGFDYDFPYVLNCENCNVDFKVVAKTVYLTEEIKPIIN